MCNFGGVPIFILFEKEQWLEAPSEGRCLVDPITLVYPNCQQSSILAKRYRLNSAFKVKMRNDEICPEIIDDGLSLSVDCNKQVSVWLYSDMFDVVGTLQVQNGCDVMFKINLFDSVGDGRI